MNIFDGLPEEKLTREQESALVVAGDTEKLVLHTIREAVTYSRRVCRGRFEDGELMGICWDALNRAAKHFDPSRQRFFAYSKPYVRGAIRKTQADRDIVKNSSLHETDVESKSVVCRSIDETEQKEISPTLGSSDEQRIEGRQYERLEPDSVEPDFKGIDIREQWAMIEPLLTECLSGTERMTIELYYKSGFTFAKIGSLLDLTKQGVQATHVRALKKLRCRLERNLRLLKEKP